MSKSDEKNGWKSSTVTLASLVTVGAATAAAVYFWQKNRTIAKKQTFVDLKERYTSVTEDDNSDVVNVLEFLNESYSHQSNSQFKLLNPKKKFRLAISKTVSAAKIARAFRRNSIATSEHHIGAQMALTMEMSEEIKNYLKGINDWSFNAIEFAKLSDIRKRPLFVAAYHIIINQRKLDKKLGFEAPTFATFLIRIEDAYKTVPYHTATHATDVLVSVNCFLDRCALLKSQLSDLESLVLLVAAIIHDAGHDGKNNHFHCESLSELALQYNDKSPLENHHLRTAFQCLYRADSNFISSLPRSYQSQFRKWIIAIVLKTDMNNHKETIDSLASFLDAIESPINVSTLTLSYENSKSSQPPRVPTIKDEHLFVMELVLHLCDISNPTKPWNIALHWAANVFNEFYQQGDLEKEMRFSVSPICDRDKTYMISGTAGFTRFMVSPFVNLALYLFPEMKELKTNLETNLERFNSILETEKENNDLKETRKNMQCSELTKHLLETNAPIIDDTTQL